MRTSQLRTRLGVFATLGAMVLSLITMTVIGVAGWRQQSVRLDEEVQSVVSRLSGVEDPSELTAVDVPNSAASFAVFFDSEGNDQHRVGDVSDRMVGWLLDDVWVPTTTDGLFTVVEYDMPAEIVVVGVACPDSNVCDTAVVGSQRLGVVDYIRGRVVWLVVVLVVVSAAVWFTTRWIVGRSLRPVEEMRGQLDIITASDLDRRVTVRQTNDELERLGRSMNATVDRLGDVIAANKRFVADAAHELRTPLAGVRAALEVEHSRSASGLIEDSISELDRAGRLVDDLLTLARQEGRSRVRNEVDLDDVLRAQIDAAQLRFPDVEVERKLAPTRVLTDPDALRRVATNLLENACRHGLGKIAVLVGQENGVASLRIDDNGPGVAVADRAMIFERFARLDQSRVRATGGSGLGLAIVRTLVDGLDGEVLVFDSPLGGASFVVRIPIVDDLSRPVGAG